MKNKVFLISLAVVLAISLILVSCGGSERTCSNKIVIGMSRSMSGCCLGVIPQASFDTLYPIYFQRLNDEEGGILVGGTRFPVEVVMLDDCGNSTILVENTYELIDDIKAGDIHFLFGPSCVSFLELQAPIANDNKVVLMAFEGSTTDYPYTLFSLPYLFMQHHAGAEIDTWAQLCLEMIYYATNSSKFGGIHIVWQDDPFYVSIKDYLIFTLIDLDCITPETTISTQVSKCGDPDYVDFNPGSVINEIKAWSPNVVVLLCEPDRVCDITAAAIAANVSVGLWATFTGGNFGWFGGAPPNGFSGCEEGVMCFATANNKTSDDMEWLFDTVLEPELGFDGLDFWNHPLYWATLQIWQDAVETVGKVYTDGYGNKCFTIDQDEFKAQLASYCDKDHAVDTILGKTWYSIYSNGGGLLSYHCRTGIVGQWQNGYLEIIGYPGTGWQNYVVTADPIYPKPMWCS